MALPICADLSGSPDQGINSHSSFLKFYALVGLISEFIYMQQLQGWGHCLFRVPEFEGFHSAVRVEGLAASLCSGYSLHAVDLKSFSTVRTGLLIESLAKRSGTTFAESARHLLME